jgi:hypothetical protein
MVSNIWFLISGFQFPVNSYHKPNSELRTCNHEPMFCPQCHDGRPQCRPYSARWGVFGGRSSPANTGNQQPETMNP